MSSEDIRIEPLNQRHNRSRFSCGVETLDRYLREQAGQDVRRHLSAIFVMCERGSEDVLGYYALSATQVEPRFLPSELAKKLPRRPLPAILIGRLAVDVRRHGQGDGGTLLVNALTRSADASKEVGAMLVIVDAKDERARAFYEHFGFVSFNDEPNSLFMPMVDAERIAKVTKSS